MTERISRAQAWCKLAVFVAEGAPVPRTQDFSTDSTIEGLHISFHAVDDVVRWASLLGAKIMAPHAIVNLFTIVHTAYAEDWFGHEVFLTCYVDASPVELVDVDMSAVRAVAEGRTGC
jgi:hypothetical protein